MSQEYRIKCDHALIVTYSDGRCMVILNTTPDEMYAAVKDRPMSFHRHDTATHEPQTDYEKSDLEQKIDKLSFCLKECALIFRGYETMHLAKGDVGKEKARTNAQYAEMCEIALSGREMATLTNTSTQAPDEQPYTGPDVFESTPHGLAWARGENVQNP